METTRLSSKGQIVLPKSVRERHQWRAGTCFVIKTTPEGVLLQPVKALPETRIEALFGTVRWNGPRRSLADMDQVIEREIKRRRARGRY